MLPWPREPELEINEGGYQEIDVVPMGGLISERLPITLADSTLSVGKSVLIEYLNGSFSIDYIQIELSVLGFIVNE